jgi:hypothetical protein
MYLRGKKEVEAAIVKLIVMRTGLNLITKKVHQIMYLGTLLGVEFNQSSSVSPSIGLRYLPTYAKY